VTLGKLVFLYRGWLRENPARELLSGLGVVVGVALVFATLTMNGSIYASSSQIMNALAGRAQLQASALSASGVPEALTLRPFPGVTASAPALEAPITLRHGTHSVATQLVGVSPKVLTLSRAMANIPIGDGSGLALPSTLARQLGVSPHDRVSVIARGAVTSARVQTVLGSENVGPIARSLVAFSYLPYAQRLLDMPRQITSVLARAAPGKEELARSSLERLEPQMRAGRTSDQSALLRQALRPQAESTSFFVLLAAVVGVLLVGTATMLSAGERRRELASLWLQGYSRRQLVAIVLSQGLALGFVGSLLGVLIGAGVAALYAESPDYLASAFPLGTGTVLSIPLAIAVLFAGTLATCACVGWVLLDVRGLRENASPALRGLTPRGRHVALLGGVALATLSAFVASSLLAALLLAAVVVLVVPSVLALFTAAARRGERRSSLTGASLAAGGIRAAELRALALAVTAGVGVFGALVAVDVHRDLLHGLEGGYRSYVSSATVWVTAPGDNLATSPLDAQAPATARSVPGVRSVRPYYGGWLDMAGRRVWMIARSAPLPAGQLVRGDRARADEQLANGDSMAMSEQLARTLGLRIGDQARIPTPLGPHTLRLAATSTNLGWSSGIVFLPVKDYVSWFGATPTALEVEAPASAVSALRRALGAGADVQTAGERAQIADALPRQGLQRLSAIAWLLVLTVSISVALALCSTIWQRRAELASLRLQSFTSRALQRVLVWESLIVVGAGLIVGVLAGVWGHLAADQYLRSSTGYPIEHSADLLEVLGVGALVILVTSLILALPGYLAARAPMKLALDGR
jgi:putative ABC transport system permease protein